MAEEYVSEMREVRADIGALREGLIEIKAILTERHLSLREDIAELKECSSEVRRKQAIRPCDAHAERLKILERIVYGTAAATAVLFLNTVWGALRS